MDPMAGLRLQAAIVPSIPYYQQPPAPTNFTASIATLMARKIDTTVSKKRKSTKLAREHQQAKLREEYERYLRRYHKKVQLQGCVCIDCHPEFYKKILHLEDQKPFSPLRGLQWRSHDAWHLATTFSNLLSTAATPPSILARWTSFKAHFQPERLQPSVPSLLTANILAFLADLFSEAFFASQLPASKLSILWCNLSSPFKTPDPAYGRTHNATHRSTPSLILLNAANVEMRISPDRAIRVLLHEMLHAFLGMYVCYPWDSSSPPSTPKKTKKGTSTSSSPCAAHSDCARLYLANIGSTGHGRAWQLLARAIQAKLEKEKWGLRACLGCHDGLRAELLGERLSLSCVKERKVLWPSLVNFARGAEVVSKDDDEVCRKAMLVRRKGTWGVRRPGRRGSI